jgi:glycosyltransferase involved in cell wall biosynthesis
LKKLSIIIPCYNEAATITEVLAKVARAETHGLEKEVIVVNDGSTDGTGQLLAELQGDRVKVIHHERNLGKGAAIRAALEQVTGDIVLIQDADLEYDPDEYPFLLHPMLSDHVEVVYGSRMLRKDNKQGALPFLIGGRLLSLLTNLLYQAGITDEPTGYKVFGASLLKSIDLKCTGFEFCPEVTAKVCKRGYEITEVPISYNPRSVSEGKKINWRDFIVHVFVLLKYRFFE